MNDLTTRRVAAPAAGPSATAAQANAQLTDAGAATDPLAPVRSALRNAARADAAATLATAERDAQHILDDAAARAAAIVEEARAAGRAEAAALLAAENARAGRHVRRVELAARRDVFDALRARVAAILRERCAGRDAERIAQRLRAAVHAHLGPDAELTDADGGGIVGRGPGRFVDASFAVLADRAVEGLGDRVEQLWRP